MHATSKWSPSDEAEICPKKALEFLNAQRVHGSDTESPSWLAAACSVQLVQPRRYLMGVGYPLDIVICVALGVDMLLAYPGHAKMRVGAACGCKTCKV